MKTKILSAWPLGIAIALAFVSCDDKQYTLDMPENRLITSITLDVDKDLPLLVGTDSAITYHVEPIDADLTDLAWKSSNELVASVSPQGVITALQTGKTVITVTPAVGFGPAAATRTINVEVVAGLHDIEEIRFQGSESELYVQDRLALTYELLPANHTYSHLVWTSSDESIATVDESGVVTGVAPGTVTIRAHATDRGGCIADRQLTVKRSIPAQGVSIKAYDKPLYWKQPLQLHFTTEPADATAATISWTSSDESIMTVSGGLVQAVGVGTATITAHCEETGQEASVNLTVAPGYYAWDATTQFEGWAINSSLGSFEVKDGKMIVKVTEDAAKRVYLQRCYSTARNLLDLNFNDYPVIAFVCDELPAGALFNINLANLGNTLNKAAAMKVEKLGGGKQLVYYDGTEHAALTNDKGVVPVRAFMFKIQKVARSPFTIDWIRTCKTIDEAREIANK